MAAKEQLELFAGKNGERRVKGRTICIPVVTGTCAFWLGKKATEYQSHKWTVYLRSPTNEDLQHVIKKVTFVLHESFQNPERDQQYPPYELTEVGWGEFDILVRVHFHDDAAEPPVDLYHRLKLYGDETAASNAKKPVVAEQYDELVVWEPTEALWRRVATHQPRAAPPSQLSQYYTASFHPETDYRRIQQARQRVAQIAATAQAAMVQLEAQAAGGVPML
eukprot:scaffold2.g6790.t1